MDVLEKHIDKPWDWDDLSRNPNISMEFIEKYPDKPWVWTGLSRNFFQKSKYYKVPKYIQEYDKKLNNLNKEFLSYYVDAPPQLEHKYKLYHKGGPGFHESCNDILQLNR